MDSFWKACKRNNLWFNIVSTKLPINNGINETTLEGITCATPGFVFKCGIQTDPASYEWSQKCLNSCQVGLCLLECYVTPLSIYKETDGPPFSSHYKVKRTMLAEYQDTWWQSLFGILVPSAGVYVSRDILRNYQPPLVKRLKKLQKSIEAQQKSLSSLAQVE